MIADAVTPTSALVLGIGAAVCGVIFAGLLIWAVLQARRPLSETDVYCAAADEHLKETERAARAAALRARMERTGASADLVTWPWPGRPDYAPFGDPEFMPADRHPVA